MAQAVEQTITISRRRTVRATGNAMVALLGAFDDLRERLADLYGEAAAEAALAPLDEGIGMAWDRLDATIERQRIGAAA